MLNRAAASVVGQATNSISNSISNIGSVSPSSTIPTPAGIAPGSKILSFPADVGDGSSNNHFVTFQIKEFKPARVSAARRLVKDAQKALADTLSQAHLLGSGEDFGFVTADEPDPFDIEGAERALRAAEDRQRLEREDRVGANIRGVTGTSIALRNSQTSQIIKTIALFMPPSVQVQYGASYKDAEVGFLAQTGFEAVDRFFETQGSPLETRLSAAFGAGRDTMKDAAQQALIKSLNAVAPGAQAIFQSQTGQVITPRFELTFERVNRRSFSYTFVMIPKSEAEAQTVQQIVTAFKMGMHPEFVESSQSFRRMKMPDLFDITYHSHGGENNFIHKISTCYLTSVNVTYGGDRFTAHEPTVGEFGRGSPPQRTTIALQFQELGILSKEDIEAGF